MAVESLPVEFVVYIMYEPEVARKTISVELPSEYPANFFDLTGEDGLESFVANVAELYGMHLYEAEVDLILKDLQPLNSDATKEEVEYFITEVVKRIVDYREYIDRVNAEIEDRVYEIEVDVPHYNWSSLLFLMRDRCCCLKDYYNVDEPDETCKRYLKDLMILEKEIDEYDLSRFLSDAKETIKNIRNIILEVSNRLNAKAKKVDRSWVKEKLSELCENLDALR